jgi:hypothetical protein
MKARGVPHASETTYQHRAPFQVYAINHLCCERDGLRVPLIEAPQAIPAGNGRRGESSAPLHCRTRLPACTAAGITEMTPT